jgi:hypothetical protein
MKIELEPQRLEPRRARNGCDEHLLRAYLVGSIADVLEEGDQITHASLVAYSNPHGHPSVVPGGGRST